MLKARKPNVTKGKQRAGQVVGSAPATNDIGLVTLPDGRTLSITVYVTNAHADESTRDSVIARIGRAAYDAAISTR